MPRFPAFAQRTTTITGSVFEKFRAKMQQQGDRLVPLHIGDAYAPPPYPLPFTQPFLLHNEGFHRYCDTFGIAPLREALAEKLREDNDLDVDAGNVLITAGATNALSVSMQAIVEPGDDVLVLAPSWPFFRGMVRMAGGRVTETPFYSLLHKDPGTNIAALLSSYVTSRTVALYVNSPNNPSGKVLTPEQYNAVCEFTRKHNLWLVSDEAYDGMTYDGRVHISPATLPGMFERTITTFTFSKLFMFSGLRIGYAVAPEPVIGVLNKTMVHQLYSPSTVAQQMLVDAVKTRRQWRDGFVAECAALRDRVVERLEARATAPEGAYYFFFPVTEYLTGRNYASLLDGFFDAGVSVAPGADFGDDYKDYIRLCFAGVRSDRLDIGIDRLNRVLRG